MAERQVGQTNHPKREESQVRQNYHPECEAAVNKQVNVELIAFYTYLSMSHYFDRDDVAFKGARQFFKKSSCEKLEHAEKLMKYQNQRGGRMVLQSLTRPENDEWGSVIDAMETALTLERTLNQSLLDLHNIAEKHNDPQMQHFVKKNYLRKQVDTIKELADYVTNLSSVGPGHGEWHFDHELCD